MGVPNALNRATEPNEPPTSLYGSTRCASGIGAGGAGAPNQPVRAATRRRTGVRSRQRYWMMTCGTSALFGVSVVAETVDLAALDDELRRREIRQAVADAGGPDRDLEHRPLPAEQLYLEHIVSRELHRPRDVARTDLSGDTAGVQDDLPIRDHTPIRALRTEFVDVDGIGPLRHTGERPGEFRRFALQAYERLRPEHAVRAVRADARRRQQWHVDRRRCWALERVAGDGEREEQQEASSPGGSHDGLRGEVGGLPTSCADRLGIPGIGRSFARSTLWGRKTGIPGNRQSLARIPRDRELLSLYHDRRRSLRIRR